jgi:hypothetical protein
MPVRRIAVGRRVRPSRQSNAPTNEARKLSRASRFTLGRSTGEGHCPRDELSERSPHSDRLGTTGRRLEGSASSLVQGSRCLSPPVPRLLARPSGGNSSRPSAVGSSQPSDVVDQRSLLKLLDRGGVRELYRRAPPTVDDSLLRQRFLDNQQVFQAVTRRLKASLESPDHHRLRRAGSLSVLGGARLSPRLSLRAPKTGPQEPTPANRVIYEAEETEGFTRRIEDAREANFRLANHRLQPLGHLTAWN